MGDQAEGLRKAMQNNQDLNEPPSNHGDYRKINTVVLLVSFVCTGLLVALVLGVVFLIHGCPLNG